MSSDVGVGTKQVSYLVAGSQARRANSASAMRATFVSLARSGRISTNTSNNNHNNHNDQKATTTPPNQDSNTLQHLELLNKSHNQSPDAPPRRSFTQPRAPLQSRDQNVSIMFRAAQKSAPLTTPRSGNDATTPTTMAFDKQKIARPGMPSLSSSAGRVSNKAPLTPRVAGSNPPSATTPSTRRPPRADATSTPNQDLSTPVSSFLGSNITPRSGSRKSRVDSPNNTPNGTPVPESRSAGREIGAATIHGARPPKVFGHSVSDVESCTDISQSDKDSKFFFASDAKSGAQPLRPAPRPTITSKVSSSSFLYANGNSLPPPTRSGGSTVGSSIGEERGQPKFFHANGSPDVRSASYFPPPGSAVSSSAPRLASSPTITSPLQRPVSPSKSIAPVPAAALKTKASHATPASSRPSHAARAQPSADLRQLKRISAEVPPRVSHVSSSSLDSDAGVRALTNKRSSVGSDVGSKPILSKRLSNGSDLGSKPNLAKRLSNGPALAVSQPSSLGFSFASPTLASPGLASSGLMSPSTTYPGVMSPGYLSQSSYPTELQEDAGEDARQENGRASVLSMHSEVPSPVKAGNSIEKMNELAAQARRERKVLDLEITNSSLESINRTLEKQMRKQTAELRRFRRLSRSGRLTIAPASSSRPSTGNLSSIGEDGEDGLLDLSEDDFDFGDGSDEESDMSDDMDDTNLSPEAIAANDAKHRERDEKRLQLDLSKHQQLLVDSQKMNQSLKRCLGWTEELIAEGKKALAYNVKVSDVQLGGRVLLPDEVDGDGEEDDLIEAGGEGGDNGDSHFERMSGISSLAWTGPRREDRDSGVELASRASSHHPKWEES